jgi:hypothetical protein
MTAAGRAAECRRLGHARPPLRGMGVCSMGGSPRPHVFREVSRGRGVDAAGGLRHACKPHERAWERFGVSRVAG